MFGPDQLSVAEASKGSCNVRMIKYDMCTFMEQCVQSLSISSILNRNSTKPVRSEIEEHYRVRFSLDTTMLKETMVSRVI